MNLNEETNSVNTDNSDNNESFSEETLSHDISSKKESNINQDEYNFGWSKYSETTNGRFAMIGFFAILLIEILSHKSFLVWTGIFH